MLSSEPFFKGSERYVLCKCPHHLDGYPVRLQNLMHGQTTGCRTCYNERPSKRPPEEKKLYQTWADMMQRCHNPKQKSFSKYGARGITVAKEWHKFEPWFEYVSNLPYFLEPGRSIDRIDNSQGYKPGNIRWATQAEQHANRRITKFVEYKGEKIVQEIFCKLHSPYSRTVTYRMLKAGIPPEVIVRGVPGVGCRGCEGWESLLSEGKLSFDCP